MIIGMVQQALIVLIWLLVFAAAAICDQWLPKPEVLSGKEFCQGGYAFLILDNGSTKMIKRGDKPVRCKVNKKLMAP